MNNKKRVIFILLVIIIIMLLAFSFYYFLIKDRFDNNEVEYIPTTSRTTVPITTVKLFDESHEHIYFYKDSSGIYYSFYELQDDINNYTLLKEYNCHNNTCGIIKNANKQKTNSLVFIDDSEDAKNMYYVYDIENNDIEMIKQIEKVEEYNKVYSNNLNEPILLCYFDYSISIAYYFPNKEIIFDHVDYDVNTNNDQYYIIYSREVSYIIDILEKNIKKVDIKSIMGLNYMFVFNNRFIVSYSFYSADDFIFEILLDKIVDINGNIIYDNNLKDSDINDNKRIIKTSGIFILKNYFMTYKRILNNSSFIKYNNDGEKIYKSKTYYDLIAYPLSDYDVVSEYKDSGPYYFAVIDNGVLKILDLDEITIKELGKVDLKNTKLFHTYKENNIIKTIVLDSNLSFKDYSEEELKENEITSLNEDYIYGYEYIYDIELDKVTKKKWIQYDLG